jgi:hypothetical protein
MIQPKWLVFMLFVWVTLTFLGATLEQHTDFNYTDTSGTTTQTTLQQLTDMNSVLFNQVNIGSKILYYNMESWNMGF